MVRAHIKHTPVNSDKPDPSQPKPPAHDENNETKVASEVGATTWPCKISGCNKVFAREADLKRHQRTTKSHSAPSFLCPRCDAGFTRMDALRRHQKSRHNGVVIELPKASRRSRSATLSPTEGSGPSRSPSTAAPDINAIKEGERSSVSPPAASSRGTTPRGNYYRQHTMSPSYGGPPAQAASAAPNVTPQPSTGPPSSSSSTSLAPLEVSSDTKPSDNKPSETSPSAPAPALPSTPPSGLPVPLLWPMPMQWPAEGGTMPPLGFVVPVPMFQPSPYYRFTGPHMIPPHPTPPEFAGHIPAIMVPYPAAMFPQFVPPQAPLATDSASAESGPSASATSGSPVSKPSAPVMGIATDAGEVDSKDSSELAPATVREAEAAAGVASEKGEEKQLEISADVNLEEEAQPQALSTPPVVQVTHQPPPEEQTAVQESFEPLNPLTNATGIAIQSSDISAIVNALQDVPQGQPREPAIGEHDSDTDAEGEVDMGANDDLLSDFLAEGDALMLSPGDLLTQESLASPS